MPHDYWNGLIGGALIGIAAVILYWFNGRIMGVSGILSRFLMAPSKELWRPAFILGLVLGGAFFGRFLAGQIDIAASSMILIIAGFLVGVGTAVSNGCTSGHGICGIARLSKRSIAATLVFMAAGILVVWLKRIGGF
jgi:uncharacterized membrane protein YedE/YeeE